MNKSQSINSIVAKFNLLEFKHTAILKEVESALGAYYGTDNDDEQLQTMLLGTKDKHLGRRNEIKYRTINFVSKLSNPNKKILLKEKMLYEEELKGLKLLKDLQKILVFLNFVKNRPIVPVDSEEIENIEDELEILIEEFDLHDYFKSPDQIDVIFEKIYNEIFKGKFIELKENKSIDNSVYFYKDNSLTKTKKIMKNPVFNQQGSSFYGCSFGDDNSLQNFFSEVDSQNLKTNNEDKVKQKLKYLRNEIENANLNHLEKEDTVEDLIKLSKELEKEQTTQSKDRINHYLNKIKKTGKTVLSIVKTAKELGSIIGVLF